MIPILDPLGEGSRSVVHGATPGPIKRKKAKRKESGNTKNRLSNEDEL